ncbi:MAG: hypothetical protein JXL97_13150 [Bacteroidales bacterium]|nr:hypothetical protein [Bacteroidales bacterium]
MKRIFTIVIAIIISSLSSFSQSNTGFTVGSNFSLLTGDSTSLPDAIIKPGFYGGMFWDINTGYKTYIQIGGFYSQQGGKYKYEYFDFGKKITRTINNKIDYVKIPLMWKQVWGDWYTSIGLYGEIAAVSNSVWTERTQNVDTFFIKSDTLQSFTNDLRLYDTGFKLALGVQFPINSQYDFFMNIAYNHGFLAINPKAFRIENKMYNRFFTINVGIIINSNSYKYRSRR